MVLCAVNAPPHPFPFPRQLHLNLSQPLSPLTPPACQLKVKLNTLGRHL